LSARFRPGFRDEDEERLVSLPQPPLILVVDDFEDNRALYAEYLELKGYRVAQAGDGEEAVQQATELLPALVVMDLSLPGVDGWEATRRLKTDPRTKHIVILALTGHAEESHERRARGAGCDEFVPKPCLPDALAEKVRAHLARLAHAS
jgi:two-component system, cell cycle response regulator DivK